MKKSFEIVAQAFYGNRTITFITEHNNGMIDQIYLNKSGDTSYSLGQRIIIKEADAHSLLDILRKLGDSIMALHVDSDLEGV